MSIPEIIIIVHWLRHCKYSWVGCCLERRWMINCVILPTGHSWCATVPTGCTTLSLSGRCSSVLFYFGYWHLMLCCILLSF